MMLRTVPDEYHCRDCVTRVTEYPHRCRDHHLVCLDCGWIMAGYARQILDAAEVHGRACDGTLRPLEVAK